MVSKGAIGVSPLGTLDNALDEVNANGQGLAKLVTTVSNSPTAISFGEMNAREQIRDLKQRITVSVIGQETVVDFLLIALLANGHLLLEGLPGLAKTRTVKTLADHLEADFRRIQFTPDMLPSDITGTEIYTGQGAGGEFHFRPGPIFGNLILADEINRAPAKAQAAAG
jgi:MoxR-like ATPase